MRVYVKLALAVGALVLGSAPPVSALPLSNLFVFGDSIVDTGNVQAAAITGGLGDPAPASLGYFEGRFTNGTNVADVLNQAIEGSNLTGFFSGGGDNFAFGGARARTDGDFVPDLGVQVGTYLATLPVDPNALYLINAGGNDVRDIVLDGLSGAARQQVLGDATAAVVAAAAGLRDAGANHILVLGAGDVGGIPEILALGNDASTAGRQASLDLNESIFASLPAGVETFDTIALFDEVLADPTAFGLPGDIDTSLPCLFAALADPSGAPTCSAFSFFDPVHPTTQIHQVFGAQILAAIPEPGVAGMIGVGLVVLAARRRRL